MSYSARLLWGTLFFLAGCSTTDVENLYIQTVVGDGCTLSRGSQSEAQGQGQGEASVASQAGTGGASGSLAEMMASIADCRGERQDE